MATELRVHTCIEMVSRKDVYTSLQSLKILYGYLQTTFHLLWTVLRKSDRLDKQCGGDAVHVNKHIHAERMHDLEIRGLESVLMEI